MRPRVKRVSGEQSLAARGARHVSRAVEPGRAQAADRPPTAPPCAGGPPDGPLPRAVRTIRANPCPAAAQFAPPPGAGLADRRTRLRGGNRKDFEAVLPLYHPDVEFVPAPELVGVGIGASCRGHDGYLALWGDWDTAWAGHAQWEPKELIDLGDRLLMLGRMRGTGEVSGIAVDTEIALLYTLNDGQVIREQYYMDPAEALEAAGLGHRSEA